MSTKSVKTNIKSIDTKSGKVKKKKFHKKGKKSKVEKDTSVKLPEKTEDFSANWKKLLTKIDSNPKKKQKKKTMPTTSPKKIEKVTDIKKPDIWFDDVDPDLLDPEDRPETNQPAEMNESKNLVKEKAFKGKFRLSSESDLEKQVG